MARFEKTRLHWLSAVLFLLGLYAIAGLAYAAYVGSPEAVTVWIVIGALAFAAGVIHQRFVGKRRASMAPLP